MKIYIAIALAVVGGVGIFAIPTSQQSAVAFWPGGAYDQDIGWHGGGGYGYHGSWGFHGPYCGYPGAYEPCASAWPQAVPVPVPTPVPVAVPTPVPVAVPTPVAVPVPVPVNSCCGCGCGGGGGHGGGVSWGGPIATPYYDGPGQTAYAEQGQSITQVNNVSDSPGSYVSNQASNTAYAYGNNNGY
jgi:hypothetical protein